MGAHQDPGTTPRTLTRESPARPFQPPPDPPSSSTRPRPNRSSFQPTTSVDQTASSMLETSLDDPPPLSTSMRHNRSESMQFLETNLDDDEGSGLVAQNANSSASGGN